MTINGSHKALAITLLLSSTLVLSVCNMTFLKLYKSPALSEEKFYQMDDVVVEKEPIDDVSSDNAPKTNQAFNTAAKPKHFAQAYQPIAPPEELDFTNESEAEKGEEAEEETSETEDIETKAVALKNNYLTAYNSVNSIISKRSRSIKASRKVAANTNSSVRYSLKNRTHEFLPVPIYLCEKTGKIIINIKVNAYGNVTHASVNSSSTSFNECLLDHALEYAKKARFNGAEKRSQLGTITFEFKGK